MAKVRHDGLREVAAKAGPAPAAEVDRLRERYGGNLVARAFGREGLFKVTFAPQVHSGVNQFEIEYRQLLSVRGQGSENVGLGFIFDAAPLDAWKRSDQFKSTVKVTFGPGMLGVLKNIGLKADAVEVGCSVGGGKAIPPEKMQRQAASKAESWMEFEREAPNSVWCTFAAPGRAG